MKQRSSINDAHLWELKDLWEQKRKSSHVSEPATDLAAIDLEYRRQQWQVKGRLVPRGVRRYVAFSSSNPRFSFTFLYPEAWGVKIFEDEGHGEVFILGPRNDANTYSLALAVHVFPAEEEGGKHVTLSQVMADRLERSKGLTGFRVISKARGSLAGVNALEFEVSYSIPLLVGGMRVEDTPIVERRILLKQAGRFCELMYRAVEEDYYTYLESFKDVVQTFKFQEDRAARAYRPLVQTPAHVIGEEPGSYETDE
ncbi:MAG: hypothetical protein ACE5HA_09490 [Anaerolineae bacterium]